MEKINQVVYQTNKRHDPENYPMIKIANNYLKNAGFNYRDKIKVEYRNEEIIIKKIANQNESRI